MNAIPAVITCLTLAILPAFGGGEGWRTDLDEAFKEAESNGKPLLVEFTGSDWCPPCMMMRKKVFTKKEFIDEASEKFILVEIDIPNGDPALKRRNIPILERYGVEGVPTVILFTPQGKEIDRFGASGFPTIKGFLERLDQGLTRGPIP